MVESSWIYFLGKPNNKGLIGKIKIREFGQKVQKEANISFHAHSFKV